MSLGQFPHTFIKNLGTVIHQFLSPGCGLFYKSKLFQTYNVSSCCLVNSIESFLDLFDRECKFRII